MTFEAIVYLLCFGSGAVCALLLVSAFRRQREPLLLWSSICFSLLGLNNLLVFVDIILLPDVDLIPLRILSELAAVLVLLYGFVWESQ